MTVVRVYEVARELRVTSEELIAQLHELGCVTARSASSTVPGEYVSQLRHGPRESETTAGARERLRDQRPGEERGFCWCCQRDGLPLAPLKLPGGLPAANTPRKCRSCVDHTKSAPSEVVAKEHRQMARTDAVLIAQIGELRSELENRPIKTVVQNLDQEVVDEAHRQCSAAMGSRDRAFRELLAIKLLHQARPDLSRCTCGLSLSACKTRTLVDDFAPLRDWEAKQRERLRRGEQHYLPEGHPASRGDLGGTAWRRE